MTHGTYAVATPASRLGALLALVRWQNALIAAAGVVVGAWWERPDAWLAAPVAWAMGAAVATAAAVNALNDALDVDIDRVAHPARPLVRGAIGRRAALVVAGLSAVVAVVASRRAGGNVPEIVSIALSLGWIYSLMLKEWGVLGNLVVAFVASLPFVAGAEAAGFSRDGGVTLLLVAIPLHFAREVVKDEADARGDRGYRRTLPLVLGAGPARAVAVAAVAAHAGLVTFLFAPFGWRRILFVPAIGLAVAALLRAEAPRAASLLKLAMLLAMAALPLVR